MQIRTFLALAVFLGAIAIPCSPQTAKSSGEDEAPIRAVLARLEQAFEERDAKLYASNFAEDADWENAFGGREKSRANIEKRLAGVYQMFQRANQTIKEIRIRFITPDVAEADVDREIVGQTSESGKPLPPRKVRTTQVLKKENGKWRVVVFRVADLRNPREVQ